jgi:hypothetical protein
MSYRFINVPERGLLPGYLTPLLTVGLLAALVIIAVINWQYRSPLDTGTILVNEITQLADIFKKIDDTCTILSFDNQKNEINFLNVKKGGFVGSQIGPMNLAHPEKWEGPYVVENLKMFDHVYQIVRTNKGYFITPGDGLKLPNGRVIGKDILLDANADIAHMMHDETLLSFNGKPLAAAIKVKQ